MRARPTAPHLGTLAKLERDAQVASSALIELLRDRELDRLRTWHATRATYPVAWPADATRLRRQPPRGAARTRRRLPG